MIKALIIIRLKQIHRELTGLGLFRVVFLLALIAFLVSVLFLLTSEESNSYFVVAGLLLLLAIIQINRKDKLFLRSHFSNYKLISLIEYSLISAPFLICLGYHQQWKPLLILLLFIFLIPKTNYSPKRKSINTTIQELIPSDCFEWKAGARKLIFLIIPLWSIGLATSFFIGSIPLVILIIGIAVLSFYERGEPYQMIVVLELNPKDFLFHKIKRQTFLFSIIVIPLIIPFVIFHWELWFIPIIEYMIFIYVHAYVILTKYAYYEPNMKSPAAQTFMGIGVIGGIIPVFIPVVFLLGIRFYFKATEKLNYYLNDYN